jgi:hypothetical protein
VLRRRRLSRAGGIRRRVARESDWLSQRSALRRVAERPARESNLDPPLRRPTPLRAERTTTRHRARDAVRARTAARHGHGVARRMASTRSIGLFLQSELKRRRQNEVRAVEAARWLASSGFLAHSDSRPGLPLRKRLRRGEVMGSEQRPSQPQRPLVHHQSRLMTERHGPGAVVPHNFGFRVEASSANKHWDELPTGPASGSQPER